MSTLSGIPSLGYLYQPYSLQMNLLFAHHFYPFRVVSRGVPGEESFKMKFRFTNEINTLQRNNNSSLQYQYDSTNSVINLYDSNISVNLEAKPSLFHIKHLIT